MRDEYFRASKGRMSSSVMVFSFRCWFPRRRKPKSRTEKPAGHPKGKQATRNLGAGSLLTRRRVRLRDAEEVRGNQAKGKNESADEGHARKGRR